MRIRLGGAVVDGGERRSWVHQLVRSRLRVLGVLAVGVACLSAGGALASTGSESLVVTPSANLPRSGATSVSVTLSGFDELATVSLRQCSFPDGGQETCATGPILNVDGQPHELDVSYALPGTFPAVFCDSPPVGSCYLKAVYLVNGETAATVPLTFAAGPPIQPPEASFTLDLSNGLTVQADASASFDPNGGPGGLSLVWDWGDGSVGDQDVANPTHEYTQPGSYEITLGVINEWGLFDVATRTVTMAGSGGTTVTTDPGGSGATSDAPIQTSLVLPASLGPTNVAISTQPASGSASGFELFDREVVIETGGVSVLPESPFVVTFTLDSTKLAGPPAVAAADVQVFRDGVLVDGCTDASAASPDPCVASRSVLADGDGVIVVRTSHFSTFGFARFDWDFSGFYSPVDNLPVVNTVNPGRAIPVKFSLGADRGLDVFADGYPKSLPYTCETGQLDQIEETVSVNSSSLRYLPQADRYEYIWKTDRTWNGCRELIFRFRDGTEIHTRFKFK